MTQMTDLQELLGMASAWVDCTAVEDCQSQCHASKAGALDAAPPENVRIGKAFRDPAWHTCNGP